MPRRALALVTLLALLACREPARTPAARTASAETIRGTVVGIHDGDTVTILDAERVEWRVRLAAIDAPERRQPFGRRAKESLSDLALGHVAEVESSKRDRYGRVVGKVMIASPDCPTRDCPNDFDVGLAQLARGSAWWYRQYAPEQSHADRRLYEAAEHDARARQLGLWTEPAPVPPWEWREANASR